MSDIAIRVENLSKMYRIGTRNVQPRGLVQAARSVVASPFAYLQRMHRPPTEEETLWALKDVSFEVKHGEVLGIIGRNGAGKSTLLKILSRITEPSSGEAHVFGRVGSLLEVGTGFHPELTGRENIYLNGAILGMKRAEIDRKFDEIVDFSGVEKFLDTPVKRYSSGMYVRLAFAVAAYLEPEILLVDEVLAVGDAPFQNKCLGKMGDVAKAGRTVLFVSHNMTAINTLCPRSVHLENGAIASDGATHIVTEKYYAAATQVGSTRRTRDLDKGTSIVGWSLVDEANRQTNVAYTGEYFCVEIVADTSQLSCEIAVGVSIDEISGTRVFGSLSVNDNDVFCLRQGSSKLRYSLDHFPLNEGRYYLTVAIHDALSGAILDRIDRCMSFEVIYRNSASNRRLTNRGNGLIIVDAQWSQVI